MNQIIINFYDDDTNNLPKLNNILEQKLLDEKHIQKLISQPWWTENHSILQDILKILVPDTHLVAVPWDTKCLAFLLNNHGLLRFGVNNTIYVPMIQSACHDNCDFLLENNKIKEYHTGYALSADRLWRFHSWGISHDDKIVETTESRIAYLTIEVTEKSI
jgi:hypothetical protein